MPVNNLGFIEEPKPSSPHPSKDSNIFAPPLYVPEAHIICSALVSEPFCITLLGNSPISGISLLSL